MKLMLSQGQGWPRVALHLPGLFVDSGHVDNDGHSFQYT